MPPTVTNDTHNDQDNSHNDNDTHNDNEYWFHTDKTHDHDY